MSRRESIKKTLIGLRQVLLSAFFEVYEPGKRGFRLRRQSAPSPGKGGAARYTVSPRQWAQIGREVLTLHEAYTGGDTNFTHENNPIHSFQAGYQFYFLPRNFYRVLHVLSNLPWRSEPLERRLGGWVSGKGRRLRILDLGCGTGAFSMAVVAWMAQERTRQENLPAIDVVLVDQSRNLLRQAEANLRTLIDRMLPGVRVNVESRAEGVERYLASGEKRTGSDGFHIAGSALMLNELKLLAPQRADKRVLRFVEPLRRRVRPGGLLLFVEPGTRKGYMNLMMVREKLAGATILYPCPHQRDCPMWTAKVGRWCHGTIALPPQFCFDGTLRQNGGVRFAMREINLAALAIQLSPRIQAPFRGRRGARVVSGRIPQKRRPSGKPTGEREQVNRVLVCGPDGRLRELPAEDLPGVPRGGWVTAHALRK